MAEGLAKSLFGHSTTVMSAGSRPCGWVHPWSVEVMKEVGIDIGSQSSKGLDKLPQDFLETLDLVITLCPEENCPAPLGRVKHRQWPFIDPAADPEETKRDAFRRTRNGLEAKLKRFGMEQGWV
jgi:arsenate reductase